MQLVAHYTPYLDLDEKLPIDEVICGPSELSRFSHLPLKDFLELWEKLLAHSIRPILEWDILMTDQRFGEALAVLPMLQLERLATRGGAIRVQDPGACEYIHTHFPQLPIQLILETGHHNAEAIMAWTQTYGPQIERVALSLELPAKVIEELITRLRSSETAAHLQFEYMGLGPLLLFHSPRSLLDPFAEDETPGWMYADSEETAHKNFLMLQNAHGTFMLHPKHHGVLGYTNELQELGVNYLRLDLRFTKAKMAQEFWTALLVHPSRAEELYSENTGHGLIRGYFHVNKSDEQFKFLKNKHLKKDTIDPELTYWGEVLASEKGSYTAIVVKRSLEIHKEHRPFFITAEGKRIGIEWPPLKDFLGEEQKLRDFQVDDVVFMPFLKGVGPRSNVFLQRDREVVHVLR